MRAVSINKIILSLVSLFLLSACTTPEPYIFNAGEFNRDSPNFAKEIKDRSEVMLCYNKGSTTPEILFQIATDECARFGRIAYFLGHQNLVCSISSPAQAVFECLCPETTIQSRSKESHSLQQQNRKKSCSASKLDNRGETK